VSTHTVKQVPEPDEGEFASRICLLGGPPDADGDVILPSATPEAHPVVVSVDAHDVVFNKGAPAGKATLYAAGNCIVAHGRAFDTGRGKMLRDKLQERGPDLQWSVAYWTSPTRLISHKPTPAELKQWPDARRIIEKWDPFEVSPVKHGPCGPACAP